MEATSPKIVEEHIETHVAEATPSVDTPVANVIADSDEEHVDSAEVKSEAGSVAEHSNIASEIGNVDGSPAQVDDTEHTDSPVIAADNVAEKSVAEEVPVAAEEVPAAAEEVPDAAEEVPAAAEEVPDAAEEVPVAAEEVPAAAEEGPVAAEEVPVDAEKVPAEAGDVPVETAENVPVAAAEEAPAEAFVGDTTALPYVSDDNFADPVPVNHEESQPADEAVQNPEPTEAPAEEQTTATVSESPKADKEEALTENTDVNSADIPVAADEPAATDTEDVKNDVVLETTEQSVAANDAPGAGANDAPDTGANDAVEAGTNDDAERAPSVNSEAPSEPHKAKKRCPLRRLFCCCGTKKNCCETTEAPADSSEAPEVVEDTQNMSEKAAVVVEGAATRLDFMGRSKKVFVRVREDGAVEVGKAEDASEPHTSCLSTDMTFDKVVRNKSPALKITRHKGVAGVFGCGATYVFEQEAERDSWIVKLTELRDTLFPPAAPAASDASAEAEPAADAPAAEPAAADAAASGNDVTDAKSATAEA